LKDIAKRVFYTDPIKNQFLIGSMLLAASLGVSAQNVLVKGSIIAKGTGEFVSFSTIECMPGNKRISADRFGTFVLSINKELNSLRISTPGFIDTTFTVSVNQDTAITFEIRRWELDLSEVRIPGYSSVFGEGGSFRLSGRQMKELPAILSEPDVIKSVQLLPGVQAGAEGMAGIHVRGGGEDQTLILMDGVPVYNSNHLFGFFSIFNPDIVASAELYKSMLPSRYGGRLSSVLDLTMREGNRRQFGGSAQIGLISSKLLIEGPIKRDTTSYVFSVRRSWLDLLSTFGQLISGGNSGYTSIGFYDVTAKINHRINSKNQLFLSAYMGKDRFRSKMRAGDEVSSYGFGWGNFTSILRWNHTFSESLHHNLSLSYTTYAFQVENNFRSGAELFKSSVKSSIRDFELKSDFIQKVSETSEIGFGVGYSMHLFHPEVTQVKATDHVFIAEPSSVAQSTIVSDIKLYAEHMFKLGNFVRFRSGFHLNSLQTDGRHYGSIQPRVTVNYDVNSKIGIFTSFFNSSQYLHLLTNSSIGLPTDLWVPVTGNIKPQTANQFSIGVTGKSSSVNWSVEVYSKKMWNLLEYKTSSSLLNLNDEHWYDRVTVGKGSSKGIEVFMQRSGQRISGFLSYTLSKTDRTFELLNQGNPFPYRYDRRHKLNFSTKLSLTAQKHFQVLFNLSSGSHVTMPTVRYEGNPVPVTTDFDNSFLSGFNDLQYLPSRNNVRMPCYHRLDLSYSSSKQKRRGTGTWIFSIYNAYNRKNAFFLFIENGSLKQFTLFPIIPSISYEFRF
jgi:hypothetical protein